MPMAEACPAPDLRLPERLTLDVATATLQQLRDRLPPSSAVVVLDAGSLQVFDSSAVAVLLELRRHLLLQGRRLQVANWPQRLRDLMGLYGVSDLLPA